MNREIKKEMKEMIVNGTDDQKESLFTDLSLQSWDLDAEGLSQSKLWEEFYNKTRHV